MRHVQRTLTGYTGVWDLARSLVITLQLHLRAEIAAAGQTGYDYFEFNLFDLQLFYAEGRVVIADAALLGYQDVQLTV